MPFLESSTWRNERLMLALTRSTRKIVLSNVCKESEERLKIMIADAEGKYGYMPDISVRFHGKDVYCRNEECEVIDEELPELPDLE